MTWGAPLLLLLLGALWLQPARAGSHSLRYFYSVLSGPLPGVPQFSAVGYVDDVPITSYTSKSRRYQPRAPWMERITAEDPQYWDRETAILRGAEQVYKADVRIVMERLNQTQGLHMFQVMYGCELRADGSAGGMFQYAFDGHDFLSLDKDKQTFTAAMDAARITQDRWNSEGIEAQRQKDYLEGECIEGLQKYLKLGEERLRTVAPQTMVTRRKTGDRTFLTGYAYGFYPREIEVKWVRNGVEIPWESSEILPNPDGTYQAKKRVEVQEGDDEKTYRYEVYHSSLLDTVTVMYVAPQTMVTRRKNGDRTFLTGYAYGFYPREIEVKWVRNGVEMPWESSEILPNPDGTYQAKKTKEVQEGDEKTYRYEVYHSSLPDTVTVIHEEKSPPMGVIIGGVIGALVDVALLAAVVWVVYSRRNMPGPRPEVGEVNQPLQQGVNI